MWDARACLPGQKEAAAAAGDRLMTTASESGPDQLPAPGPVTTATPTPPGATCERPKFIFRKFC